MQDLKHYNEQIPIGWPGSIPKEELGRRWGLSVKSDPNDDRQYRRIMHSLRTRDNGDGMIIVSDHTRSRVYRTNNIYEIAAYRKTIKRKGGSTLQILSKIDRTLLDQANGKQVKFYTFNRMRDARLSRGLRNMDVVIEMQKAGISSFNKPLLSYIENNHCRPTPEMWAVFYKLYGLTPESLIWDSVEIMPP